MTLTYQHGTVPAEKDMLKHRRIDALTRDLHPAEIAAFNRLGECELETVNTHVSDTHHIVDSSTRLVLDL